MSIKIKLIAIGNEIIKGQIVNSNSAFISQELMKEGYLTEQHLTIGDDKIKETLQIALKNFDLVIATGGLGPTLDDLTKKEVAELFQVPLVVDQKWKQVLIKRDLKKPFLENQASIPKGAMLLENQLGTAPGLILKKENKFLILLPGVPSEMQSIFVKKVLPFIKKYLPIQEKLFSEEANLCLLKEVEVEKFLEKFASKINAKTKEKIQIGIYPHYATLKITFTLASLSEKKAKERLQAVKKDFEKAFQRWVFPSNETLASALKNLFTKKRKTLAVAESCTGGALSAALTEAPGASSYFLGSLVAYHNDLKTSLLKVDKTRLKKYGAVSFETVSAMLKGLFELTQADYGIAVSGIAGPSGGSLKKPVGTVFLAIGKRNQKADLFELHLPPKRKEVINFAISFALSRLWVKINSL